MVRLLTALVGLAVAIPSVPAAPVPEHLFPKDPPLYYCVQPDSRLVYEGNVPYTLVVTSSEKDGKDGVTTVTITRVLRDGTKTLYQKLAVSRRGILWLEDGNGPFDNPVWLLKSPVRPGEEWAFTTSGPAVADTKGMMKVVGPEDVETPAGKFSAVRIEQKTTVLRGGKPAHEYRVTSWYAPGVGVVKWVSGGSGAELKSFTPGK